MRQSYSTADQIMANANYKQAAHYDLDGSKIVLSGDYVGTLREATLYVLERIVCPHQLPGDAAPAPEGCGDGVDRHQAARRRPVGGRALLAAAGLSRGTTGL